MTALVVLAMIPAAATPLFVVWWTWFERWRRHPGWAALLVVTIVGTCTTAAIAWRAALTAGAVAMPLPARIAGGTIVAASFVLGIVADRQLGLRVRSFMPFFEDDAKIALRTTGAYAVVRHPIYAAGGAYQLGMVLVTGAPVIAAAWVVFAAGAAWFTRQEERRLRARLAEPEAYDRYRARVPALLPWPRPRQGARV